MLTPITGNGSVQAPVAERPIALPPVRQQGSAAMGQRQPYHALPLELSTDDPGFSSQMALWAFGSTHEMQDLVVATKKTIATSRALMAEADRILALCWR